MATESNYRIGIGLPNGMRVTVRRDALDATPESNVVMEGIRALKVSFIPMNDRIEGRVIHAFPPIKGKQPTWLYDVGARGMGMVLARDRKDNEFKVVA